MNGYSWTGGGPLVCLAQGQSPRCVQAPWSFPHRSSASHRPSSHPSSQTPSPSSGTKSRRTKIQPLPSNAFATQTLCSTWTKVALIAAQLSIHIQTMQEEPPSPTANTEHGKATICTVLYCLGREIRKRSLKSTSKTYLEILLFNSCFKK